jgi:myo-inositol-1(or 4)-monophosphatase
MLAADAGAFSALRGQASGCRLLALRHRRYACRSRTPLVAVNVALHGAGGVLAATTADPFSGEVFWIGGEGAHVRSEAGDAPLRPDPGSRLADLDLDPPFPNAAWIRAADLLTDDRFTLHPQVLSTSLALVWVVDGRRVAYVTDGHLQESVHYAAPAALRQVAGYVMTNLAGGPVHTGVQGLVAAADAAMHAAILALLSDGR